MMIIGITGTNGAGKGTVVDFLVNKYGFSHFSVRDFLIKELKKRNLDINRDTMFEMANELRKEHGAAYIIEQLYNQAKQKNKNSVIESIRTIGEVDLLRKQKDFILIAVDADINTRYKRSVLRNSETDKISFEQFVEKEHREMNTNSPDVPNINQCMKQANYLILNNEDKKALEDKVSQILSSLNL